MNNQMPIKEGVGANNGYRQQVGNNQAASNVPSSSAMNHLLLGKKPLVNAKPRRGPHPGAIPPEARRPASNGVNRSVMNKKPSVPTVFSNIPDQIPCNDKSKADAPKRQSSDVSNPALNAGTSVKEAKKAAAAMSVTQVACPQVNIFNLATAELIYQTIRTNYFI